MAVCLQFHFTVEVTPAPFILSVKVNKLDLTRKAAFYFYTFSTVPHVLVTISHCAIRKQNSTKKFAQM